MLAKAAQVCVASLCLAATTTTTTTTTTEAFFAPPSVFPKRATPSRVHQQQQRHGGVSCGRCNTSPVAALPETATVMKGNLHDDDNTSRRSRLSALLRSRLQPRHRVGVGSAEQEGDEGVFSAAEAGGDQESMRLGVQRRARQAMHRSFVAVATAVIVRASFSPQAASAVGLYRPRMGEGGTSTSRQVRSVRIVSLPRQDIHSGRVCWLTVLGTCCTGPFVFMSENKSCCTRDKSAC